MHESLADVISGTERQLRENIYNVTFSTWIFRTWCVLRRSSMWPANRKSQKVYLNLCRISCTSPDIAEPGYVTFSKRVFSKIGVLRQSSLRMTVGSHIYGLSESPIVSELMKKILLHGRPKLVTRLFHSEFYGKTVQNILSLTPNFLVVGNRGRWINLLLHLQCQMPTGRRFRKFYYIILTKTEERDASFLSKS
jgi:hypothetical protein